MKYRETPEIVLGNIPEIVIPELQVSYDRSSGKQFLGSIYSPEDVAIFIKRTFGNGEIELQEHFIVLYLNQANNIIGYYKHSKGAINATIADIRIILGAALKCVAVSMVISHNHPSSNLKSSRADDELTAQVKAAAATHSIKLLDHIIVTKEGHFSYADSGMLGLEGVQSLKDNLENFVNKVEYDLKNKIHHNKRSIEKIAAAYGIIDKTEIKELTELAIVKRARELAHSHGNIRERFDKIVDLYNLQVNLSHRTSQSILLQQYSTPAPIAYLAGVFCGIDKSPVNNIYFEPSAGNGLLTIAGIPQNFI